MLLDTNSRLLPITKIPFDPCGAEGDVHDVRSVTEVFK
jgi:hypothetical protein